MPIDLYGSIKKTSQWAFGSPFLNGVLSSTVVVAIMISLIMIFIIMIMYPAKSGTPFSIVAKMFVYMFFSTMLVVFLHDSVLKYMIEESNAARDANNFVATVTGGDENSNASFAGMRTIVSPVVQTKPTTPDEHNTTDQQPVSGGGLSPIKPPLRPVNPYR